MEALEEKGLLKPNELKALSSNALQLILCQMYSTSAKALGSEEVFFEAFRLTLVST